VGRASSWLFQNDRHTFRRYDVLDDRFRLPPGVRAHAAGSAVSRGWETTLKRPGPERVKKWQTDLKAEQRLLDREMRRLEQAQATTRAQLKQLASKGETKHARHLARELVASRKQKDRMATSKATLSSINMQLTHQLGRSSRCRLHRR
jgi:hypothetical protein